VNLYVERGELRALIGPNGAGKTTLLDVICGQVKPDTGRVIFAANTDLTVFEPYQIAALGIGRKFQTPSVFKHLTLLENLTLSLPQRWDVWSTLFATPTPAHLEKMSAILGTLGLLEKAHHQAGSLSHGETQWLEIGMVMAQDPALLLLDEPVAGMTGQEREHTAQLLQRMAQDHAVLVVEHDMEFVRQTAQKVTVLHEGAVLCEGAVDRVQQDPRVVEVYLGRGYHADAHDSRAQRRLWRQPDPVGRSPARP
jgi:urea transport system ATP-binding protein